MVFGILFMYSKLYKYILCYRKLQASIFLFYNIIFEMVEMYIFTKCMYTQQHRRNHSMIEQVRQEELANIQINNEPWVWQSITLHENIWRWLRLWLCLTLKPPHEWNIIYVNIFPFSFIRLLIYSNLFHKTKRILNFVPFAS